MVKILDDYNLHSMILNFFSSLFGELGRGCILRYSLQLKSRHFGHQHWVFTTVNDQSINIEIDNLFNLGFKYTYLNSNSKGKIKHSFVWFIMCKKMQSKICHFLFKIVRVKFLFLERTFSNKLPIF